MFQSRKTLPLVATAAAALWLAGCVEAEKAGRAQLLSFDIIGPDGAAVPKDPLVPVPVASPRSSFTALFDNPIDFELVQDADAGVGKPGVVTVTAPNAPMVTTLYTPNGHHQFTLIYPKGPTITANLSPGLPSGVPVTVTLDAQKLRAKDGQPAIVPPGMNVLSFVTAPFSVGPAAMQMAYPADAPLTIATSNLPEETFGTKVVVTGVGADMMALSLETEVKPVEGDPTQFTIANKNGAWPEGATITVTIAADAADFFGMPLAAPTVITFPVAIAAAAAP